MVHLSRKILFKLHFEYVFKNSYYLTTRLFGPEVHSLRLMFIRSERTWPAFKIENAEPCNYATIRNISTELCVQLSPLCTIEPVNGV